MLCGVLGTKSHCTVHMEMERGMWGGFNRVGTNRAKKEACELWRILLTGGRLKCWHRQTLRARVRVQETVWTAEQIVRGVGNRLMAEVGRMESSSRDSRCRFVVMMLSSLVLEQMEWLHEGVGHTHRSRGVRKGDLYAFSMYFSCPI